MNIKTILQAYNELNSVFYCKNTNYAEKMFLQCKIEEKSHRNFMCGFKEGHTKDTISISHAAKLFCVKRIAEYISDPSLIPTASQFNHVHNSCLMAAGIVAEYGNEIKTAWKNYDLHELAGLNYCNYVKVKK